MFQKKIKIGLLGGSFNPAHEGHLHISAIAFKKLGLKQVWWVVSPQNPLKNSYNKSFGKRFDEAKLVAKNLNFIKITDIEHKFLKVGYKFYTINLIKKLKAKYKNYEFYFIIGADSLINFDKWFRWQQLLDEVNLVCVSRAGNRYQQLASKAFKTNKIKFIDAKLVKISSTEIRAK